MELSTVFPQPPPVELSAVFPQPPPASPQFPTVAEAGESTLCASVRMFVDGFLLGSVTGGGGAGADTCVSAVVFFLKLSPAKLLFFKLDEPVEGPAVGVLASTNVPARSASLRFVSVKLASPVIWSGMSLTFGSRFLWLPRAGFGGGAADCAVDVDVDGLDIDPEAVRLEDALAAASGSFFLFIETSGEDGAEKSELTSLAGGVVGRGRTDSFPFPYQVHIGDEISFTG